MLLICLVSTATKKLHVITVRHQLQKGTLYDTKRDVQLEHCIVANIPLSPQNHKMILITILLRSTAPPKLDVTFKCKLCNHESPRFYALRQHRNTQHGMQIGSVTRDVDVEHKAGDVEEHRLR